LLIWAVESNRNNAWHATEHHDSIQLRAVPYKDKTTLACGTYGKTIAMEACKYLRRGKCRNYFRLMPRLELDTTRLPYHIELMSHQFIQKFELLEQGVIIYILTYYTTAFHQIGLL
jgi:hypothetical protein